MLGNALFTACFVSPPPFLLLVSGVEVVFFLACLKQQFGLCRAFASGETGCVEKHTGNQVISQITILSNPVLGREC